jgi:hypothetical protein
MIMLVPMIVAAPMIVPGVIPAIMAGPVIVSGVMPVIVAGPVIVIMPGILPAIMPFPHPPRMAPKSHCSTSTSATSVLLRTPRAGHDHASVRCQRTIRNPWRNALARAV